LSRFPGNPTRGQVIEAAPLPRSARVRSFAGATSLLEAAVGSGIAWLNKIDANADPMLKL
jgi:hypothetical protein